MDNEKQPSSVNIKQRIIGAVVLIALAVIIIPSVLDLRQDYDHVIRGTNIVPKPDNFRVEVFEFGPQMDIKVPVKAVNALLSVVDDSSGQQRNGVDSVVTAGPEQAQHRIDELRRRLGDNPEGQMASGQVKAEAWVVQLASLSRKENALNLRQQVRQKGLHAFIVSSQVKGKTMYRVLVGPELLRSNAERQRQRLYKEMKLDGMVVKHRR